ncbi:Protein cornichon-like 4, partial [Cucurbita argyrosperma subsp. sororia]
MILLPLKLVVWRRWNRMHACKTMHASRVGLVFKQHRESLAKEEGLSLTHHGDCSKRSMGDLFVWLISFFSLVALLIVLVYQLMCLADLEFDYINPYDSASRINKVVMPEFVAIGVLCVFYLLTGHWGMSMLCGPYIYYNVRLYLRRQYLVDVTEIFNMLNWEKKRRLFKLAYLVFLLFLSIFWMIYSALEDDE